MEIVTKRFLLRDFIKEDEPSFLAYHADPKYAEFCDPKELTPCYMRKLLKLFQQWAEESPRQNYQLAICDRQNPQNLIGCCGLRCKEYGDAQAEIGIDLASQYWSRYAYAIEIANALIQFGFCDLGLETIYGVTISANSRVIRLAQRYGFIQTNIRPCPDWLAARGWHQIEWQITQEVWEEVRSKERKLGERNR